MAATLRRIVASADRAFQLPNAPKNKLLCQPASKTDPRSACNIDPWALVFAVDRRRSPEPWAERSA